MIFNQMLLVEQQIQPCCAMPQPQATMKGKKKTGMKTQYKKTKPNEQQRQHEKANATTIEYPTSPMQTCEDL